MARMWAYILKENGLTANTTGFGDKAVVNGPVTKYTAVANQTLANGTENTDFIIPDIENQGLEMMDTCNQYGIASYGSLGATRLTEVVGHSVAGAYSGKLYSNQAAFLLDWAIRKKNITTNPTGDIPSVRIDRCHWDSDIVPGIYADSYLGCKVGQLSLTAGVSNPFVAVSAQIIGSRFRDIPVTGTGNASVPAYAKEPDCTSYPVDPFLFRHVSVYVDFDGAKLIPDNTLATWDISGLASKKVNTVRSVGLVINNQLSTSSHAEGVLDRIARVVSRLQFSLVLDMMDSGPATTVDPKSRVWLKKYRDMRTAGANGNFSMVVVLDDGKKRIIFDFGRKAVQMSIQRVFSLTEIFALQISGESMYDGGICNSFDWNIQDVPQA